STDDSGTDFARLAEADHGETDDREVAEFTYGLHAGADVHELRHGEGGVVDADALGALANVDDAVFIAIVERAKQYAANDAEDGGVGADAERERNDDGGGEAFTAP